MSDLRDNIGKTAKARFNAHRRLYNHNVKSMLVIILYSTVLLLTSIAEVSGIAPSFIEKNNTIGEQLNKLIPISLSLVILVYSSIIFFANYSVRAEKFHQCGLELNNLARKYDIEKSNPNFIEIKYNKSYENILKRYENHSYVDHKKENSILDVSYLTKITYDNFSYIFLAISLLSYVIFYFKRLL